MAYLVGIDYFVELIKKAKLMETEYIYLCKNNIYGIDKDLKVIKHITINKYIPYTIMLEVVELDTFINKVLENPYYSEGYISVDNDQITEYPQEINILKTVKHNDKKDYLNEKIKYLYNYVFKAIAIPKIIVIKDDPINIPVTEKRKITVGHGLYGLRSESTCKLYIYNMGSTIVTNVISNVNGYYIQHFEWYTK